MSKNAKRVLGFFTAAALFLVIFIPIGYAAARQEREDVFTWSSQERPELTADPAQGSGLSISPSAEPMPWPGESPVPSPGAEPSAKPDESPIPASDEKAAELIEELTPTLNTGLAATYSAPTDEPEGIPAAEPSAEPGAANHEEPAAPGLASAFSARLESVETKGAGDLAAKIGTIEYSDLQAAVDEAQNGATIALLRDVDGGVLDTAGEGVQALLTVPAGKNLTLDLAGHTIFAQLKTDGSNYASKYILLNQGELTIQDTRGGGTIANTNGTSNPCTRTVKNTAGAALNVTGGTITSAGAVAILNLGTCTISGETTAITSTRDDNNAGGGWDNAYAAIENRQNGQLTISGGSVSSVSRAALFCDSAAAKATVTGGTLSGNLNYGAVNGSEAVHALTVSGGRWNSDPSAYIGGSSYVSESEGWFIVQPTQDMGRIEITSETDLAAKLNGLGANSSAEYILKGNVTLNASAVLAGTAALRIPTGASLTVAEGAVLTLNGQLENSGALTVNGYITQPAKITGDGTVEGLPLSSGIYTVSTPMQLQWLAYLAARGEMPGTVVLANDITMPQGTVFQTLGEAENLTLDGRGHTISGLRMQSTAEVTGLFVWLDHCTIKDITLQNCDYQTATGTVGGIVGQAKNSRFENVMVSGSIAAAGTSYGMGGIAGSVYQAAAESTVFAGCVSTAALGGAQAYNIGAVFGTAEGCGGSIGIYNCANGGAITAKGSVGYVFGFGYLDAAAALEIIGFNNSGTVNGAAGTISSAAGNPNSFTYKTDFADGALYTAVETGNGWEVYNPVKMGEHYYSSLAAAMSAVGGESDITIELLGNVTAAAPIKIPAGKTVAIAGGGHTVTGQGLAGGNLDANSLFLVNGNLTLQNLNIQNVGVGVRAVGAGSAVAVENCNITASHYAVAVRNINQKITVAGGVLTAWAAVMTSAGDLGTATDTGTQISLKDARLAGTAADPADDYGVVTLQENYNQVTLEVAGCTVTAGGAYQSCMQVRSFGNAVTVKNSTLDASASQNENMGAAVTIYTLSSDTSAAQADNTFTLTGNTVRTAAGQRPYLRRLQAGSLGGGYATKARGLCDRFTIDGIKADVLPGEDIGEVAKLADAGAELQVYPGSYRGPVALTGIAENLTLKAGGEVLITGGLTGNNWSGLTIEGFTFKDGGVTLLGWSGKGELFFRNVTLRNNRFVSEAAASGINVNISPDQDTATGLKFLNNEFSAAALPQDTAKSFAAINLSLAVKSGSAEDNEISGNWIAGAGRGIQANQVPTGQKLTLKNNVLEDVLLRGIQLAGAQAGAVEVMENTLKNCGTGLRLHESYDGEGGALTFAQNSFVGCAEDLWNLSPNAVLDGSRNYYGGGSPKCNLSKDGSLPNFEVKCTSYYEDEARTVLLNASKADSELPAGKVEMPELPAGAPAGTTITAEEKEKAVDGVKSDVTANTQAARPAEGLAKAAAAGCSQGDTVYLKITLNDMELRAGYDPATGIVLAPAALQFEVQPYVKPASGPESALDNTSLNGGEIVFRLPVPSSVAAGSQAKVQHLNQDGSVKDVQWPQVQQENGEHYLTVTASSFSRFLVVFHAQKLAEPGEGGQAAEQGAAPAAEAPAYNWLGVLAQLQALGEKGTLTVDIARELAVPQYIWQQIFGKNVTVTFLRGLDSFAFNGAQLLKAGFDPDHGHNLADLAGFTTGALGVAVSTGDTPEKETPEQPSAAPQAAPAQGPQATPPAELPQAAPSSTPAPAAAPAAGAGMWVWLVIAAAVLLLAAVLIVLVLRRRR